jgi:Mn-dependent DtxR family transcriptional regulator
MSLSPTEADILVALLLIGDALPLSIAEITGRHPRSVSRSVPKLVDRGLVVEKHRSVYVLTPRGYRKARRLVRQRSERGDD